jgi:hypothetical protein
MLAAYGQLSSVDIMGRPNSETRNKKGKHTMKFMQYRFAVLLATVILGSVAVSSGVFARGEASGVGKEGAPLHPYGTDAEIQQCVTNTEASLEKRSILSSGDTAVHIQDRGVLEDLGAAEYGVMVGRCMARFFHRYNRVNGRPQ